MTSIPISFAAADDSYKPYLHKPSVPEHPKVKLYGKYQTNLFPGAGTYTYEIEVPKGTNNLQPSLAISYNSQSMKQRPSFLGAGWLLSQNYIYRDVNFTPSNTTDDEFKLILNNANYDLIYDKSDGLYHTEIETFAKIQNITNNSNTYNRYWLLTLKDGTKLRFGYNLDSELTSNMGYNYALRWSLDQIEDLHGNNISYSYSEDPHPEDNGTAYLHQILYNNDQKRKIEFSYENSNRPDRRLVYEQGNKVEESRRLTDIDIFFNNSLVRRYNFSYKNLNDENSLSSLNKIKYIGNDNSSVLHTIRFGYYESNSFYSNSTKYNVSTAFQDSAGVDLGLRLIDLNNDGFIDILQGRQSTSEKKAWLNNRTEWNQTSLYVLPDYFIDGSNNDKGLRIEDLNLDGFPDLIQGWGGVRKAWLNNGSAFGEETIWAPSIDFVTAGGVDEGVQLIDFNGDGRVDILQSKENGAIKKAYLNTGNGWKDVSSLWVSPVYFSRNDATGSDYGARLVDVNADGLIDILQGYNFGTQTRNAYLNNGSGWVQDNRFAPSDDFTTSSKLDNGIRLIDLNGDGLIDLFQDYANGTTTDRDAWLNNGTGWKTATEWKSSEPFTKDGKNIGRRIGDVNGDGFGDVIIGYDTLKYTLIRNQTFPYLLRNITNEFGGITKIEYTQSTKYNNTGDDGKSDIGFNVWVVEKVVQDNNLKNNINGLSLTKFNTIGNTNYSYFGGKYDYNDSEFRGFSIVNETLADNTTIEHHFFQSDSLKGKEFGTITYDSNNNLFLKQENNYNITTKNSNGTYFIVHLDSSSTYQYDGISNNPTITNISYKYDDYSNVIEKIQFGDININGDEKYERYEFAYNNSLNILDKVSKYTLLGADNSTILRQTRYYYDNKLVGLTKGDLTKQEDYLDDGTGNPTINYNYDDFGNPYRQTDPLGRTIIYYYGSKDTTNTYPDRRVNELGHAVDYEYDVATGNLLSETKNGITTYFNYDVFERIAKEIMPYDSSDLPTKIYTYDFDGIAPEIIKVSQKTTSNNTLNTYYYYDGFANLIQIKTPAEDGQQVVKNIFYDGLFRVKEEQNPYFDDFSTTISNVSNTTNTTKYNYDTLSRITSVINPDGTLKQTQYNKSTIKDFDENNNFKTYYLDAYDRIIAVEEHNTDFYIGDNLTYNTTYSYNGADELVSIKDNEGNNFNFTYNSLGQKIQLDDPDLGTWKYGYDFAGNLIKQTDNKENQILMGYDGLNRITHKNYTEKEITFTYDKQYQGTLTNQSYENFSYSYDYDDKLRIIKETAHMEDYSFVTGNTYDSANRIIEHVLPDNSELDVYYDAMGKINEIKDYINGTSYNAFGNPLNRTYFNSKITTFDYYSDNARLKQIKTDTIQELNYSYDAVGNIVTIDDGANNRTHRMSYDNLNRLTNITINDFSWVYHFDSIGRILKVVRNFTETTFLKYSEGPAHAPHKVIKTGTGVDVYRHSNFNGSNKTKVFEFYLVNEKNDSLTNVNWTAGFGDGSIINSTQEFNLTLNDNVLVVIEHNYTKGSDYRINFTGRSGATATDYEILKLLFGATANDLTVIKKNGTLIVTQFSAENTINELSENWGWNCSNGVLSTIDFNMSANQGLFVVMEHNYSLSSLNHNLTCKVNSTDGNQSLTLPFEFNSIEVENYNSTLKGDSGIEVQFQIVNYFDALDVNWNITAKDQVAQSSAPITLQQGERTTITQEFNFTTRGVKPLKIIIYSGNFSDTYSENIRLYSLDILDFLNIVKNGTTRIFNFIIQNDWINLTAYWNVSDPVVENETVLDTNESLIVVIEENFPQGRKEVEVRLYNQTVLEDKVTEIFTIKEIGIDEFETLHQNDSWAVTSALIVNNIAPLNLSWQLNNSKELISSVNNTELATNEKAFIIIESNFLESGIYPLTMMINSSTKNDNETGVAIS